MSSPDRLAQLLHQRALVSQHLAWLDAEIAANTPGSTPSPASPELADRPAATAALELPTSADSPTAPSEQSDAVALANARADEIINRYRTVEALNPADTKRSCLLLIIAVLLFSTAIIIGIYLLRYR